MKNYADEFYKKYERPVIEKMTVGFAGIDPPISQNEIKQSIKDCLSEFDIHTSSQNDFVGVKIILTADDILQKYVLLPNDCDTSKFLNVFLQGLLTEQNTDWRIEDNKIIWEHLEFENIVQVGDKIFIEYHRR